MIAVSMLALFIVIAAIKGAVRTMTMKNALIPICDVCRYHKAHHL